jgi:hypothetical protein
MSLLANFESDLLALDSHVHIHDLADVPGFLESALLAFRRVIGEQAADSPFSGILVLTEPQSRPTFAALQQRIGVRAGTGNGTWSLAATGEKISLRATRQGGGTLFLLSGQQIVTGENLEVLSLLTQPVVPDGLDLAETVGEVLRLGGLPVLPWGVGKWFGRRGQIISNLLAESRETPIFLGDNGGRPSFWTSVPQFRQAKSRGIAILRGSDPLRCSYGRRGAGSYGTLLTCPLDPDRPGQSLRDALTDGNAMFGEFGRLDQPWHFLKDQLALRIS